MEPTVPTARIATVAVTVTGGATSLVPGESAQLAASASTASGQVVKGAQFTWLSEAPNVVIVDAGRVTAVRPGTASIAATANAVRATVTITGRPVATDAPLAVVAPVRNVAYLATNGFDSGGRSAQALDVLIGRLNAFHTTRH